MLDLKMIKNMINKTITQKVNSIYFSLNDDDIIEQELSNYFYDKYSKDEIYDYLFFK